MSEDLRDVPSRGDQLVDRAEYRRLSWEGAKARLEGVALYAEEHGFREGPDIRAALERVEELERLRNELAGVANTRVNWQAALAEVERLRAERAEIDRAALAQAEDLHSVRAKLAEAIPEDVMMRSQETAAENEALKAEVERLRKALEKMVKDGCGFAPRICPERSPDPEDWCWSCQARAALRGGGE